MKRHRQDHFPDVRKMVEAAGCRNHFVGVNKMVGAGRQYPHWVPPFQGSECGDVASQGVALGYRVDAPLARKSPRTNGAQPVMNPRTNGAKPASPGHRPGNTPPFQLFSPERAKPNTAARELEAKIAENVVELLEA